MICGVKRCGSCDAAPDFRNCDRDRGIIDELDQLSYEQLRVTRPEKCGN